MILHELLEFRIFVQHVRTRINASKDTLLDRGPNMDNPVSPNGIVSSG